MKILIADDNNADRLILKAILIKSGHEVAAAIDGLEAVELFKQETPDIILLDALMPNMDGYEAAIEIKKLSGEDMIPIIFLTSLKEASALARCLEVGGDDFLTKPYNKVILQAKIKAFERMKLIYDEVKTQRNDIQFFTDHMIHEQEVAKRVFDNIAHSGNLDQSNIRHLLSPMSIFNGDLLLCARTPSKSTHILLGDFTGHGLPAAIGALPVAEIFYGMTVKGFSISDIMIEINTRLSTILPIGVFCCATACEVNYREQLLTVWSGGLPEGYIFRQDEGIVNTIRSNHLPLGVLKANTFKVDTEVYRFSLGDKLYIFSDGILESEAPDGTMFGAERVLELIEENRNQESLFQPLLSKLGDFCQSDEQNDDLTLIEYTFDKTQYDKSENDLNQSNIKEKPLDWCIEYELRPETLKSFDPLPLVLQILMECPGLKPFRGTVFTILAEIYSNALDHGVLGLDSSMKNSVDGFSEYYQQRKIRLDSLNSGFVRIKMEHLPTETGGDLILAVEDSGVGFNTSDIKNSDNSFSGRGLELVRSLCKKVEHSNQGRTVNVVFQWKHV